MAGGKKVGSIYTEIRARLDKLDRDYKSAYTKSKTAAGRIQSAVDKISFDHASDSYRRFAKLFAVGIAGYGLKSLATSALDVASSFEMMQIKLDSLTRGRGKETLEALNTWALKMPVDTRKAVDTFVMMQAMGLDPTIAKMQTLTDVASIFGQDAMPRVARSLGQMATLGKLSAEELNQLSAAGINARKYLTEAFGMTVEQLQKSQVSIKQIIDTIWKGLDADYAGAALKAQSSWQGLTVTFKSYLEEMARQVMEAGVFDELKTQLDGINKRMKVWLETNRELIASSVPVYIDKIKGSINRLYEILSYDPDIIQWGLVGLLIYGKKGAALMGGLAHLGNVVMVQAKAFKAFAEGQITFGQIAGSNYAELKKLTEGVGQYSVSLGQAHGNVNRMGDALQAAHDKAKTFNKQVVSGGGSSASASKNLPAVPARANTDYTDFWQRQAAERYEIQSRMYDVLIEQEKAYVEAGKDIGKDMWLVKAEDMKRIADQAKDAGSVIQETFEDSFTSAGYSLSNFLLEGEMSFKKFANSIISDFARIGLQKAIGMGIASIFPSAKGNVFDAGGAVPFARGGIVRRPTVFPFAGGAGLMGEAGPEAIMPLTRTAGGELGVKSEGGGQKAATYNIFINAVDSQSFTELTRRNPEAIIGPVRQALQIGDRGLIGLLREVR